MLALNESDLLVTLDEFSKIACLDGRLFGVQTISDRCNLTLNSCLRSHALEALIAANRRAEIDLGYDLIPRYHSARIRLPKSANWETIVTRTLRPGIAAMNVKQTISPLVQGVVVNPYVGTAPVSDGGHGHCIVTVSKDLVENPSKVMLRDDDGKLYYTEDADGYPRRVGSDWEIAIRTNSLAPICSTVTSLNVQHSQLVHVDIPSSTSYTDCAGNSVPVDQFLPVYPESGQFIPMARPMEHVGSFYRYWFNVWVLVDPAFEDENVDLTHAEFYKLRPVIDFVAVYETAAGPDVTYRKQGKEPLVHYHADCLSPPTTSDYDTQVLNAVDGLVKLTSVKNVCDCGFPGDCYDEIEVQFYYKTDPAILGLTPDLSNIATAIAYRTAAELPSNFCGCEITEGFIAEAQKSFGDARVNPMSGETIWVVKFGDKVGHLTYLEKMSSAPKYQPLRSF